MDLSLVANDGESALERSIGLNQSMQSYQVGEIDENGFVCIGIEERKVRGDMNRSQLIGDYKGGLINGGFSDNASDYSSSEEYSSFSSDAKSN